jgi:hypothetical protein
MLVKFQCDKNKPLFAENFYTHLRLALFLKIISFVVMNIIHFIHKACIGF